MNFNTQPKWKLINCITFGSSQNLSQNSHPILRILLAQKLMSIFGGLLYHNKYICENILDYPIFSCSKCIIYANTS